MIFSCPILRAAISRRKQIYQMVSRVIIPHQTTVRDIVSQSQQSKPDLIKKITQPFKPHPKKVTCDFFCFAQDLGIFQSLLAHLSSLPSPLSPDKSPLFFLLPSLPFQFINSTVEHDGQCVFGPHLLHRPQRYSRYGLISI
jgi:hypothetical protein